MWQRFTEKARRTILLAQQEAQQMKAHHIGTEHILLGLLLVKEAIAPIVLAEQGIRLEKVRPEVEALLAPGLSVEDSERKLSQRAKSLLENAADEGRRLNQNYVGTEHFLLALLSDESSQGHAVLSRQVSDLDAIREAVLSRIAPIS